LALLSPWVTTQQRWLNRPSLTASDSCLYKYLKNQTTTKWLEKYLAEVNHFSVPQLDKRTGRDGKARRAAWNNRLARSNPV